MHQLIFLHVFLHIFPLCFSFPYPGALPSVYYYKELNKDEEVKLGTNSKLLHWLPSGTTNQADFKVVPPTIARLHLAPGDSYPDHSYWTSSDIYYVAINGSLTWTGSEAEQKKGDIYWVLGGHLHGPVTCSSQSEECVLVAISDSKFVARGNASYFPSDDNPTVIPGQIKERFYLQAEAEWHDGTHVECEGDIAQTMHFDAVENSPPLFRAHWPSPCSVGYHYHPKGIMYVTTMGTNIYTLDTVEGYEDIPVESGEVRWARPGHAYGPEYRWVESIIPSHFVDIHSLSSETMFTVVGFDAKPISGPPPPGPYKMQRTTTITHVFDDEL